MPLGSLVHPLEAKWPAARKLAGCSVTLEALDPYVHGDGLWEAVGGMENAALWHYMHEGPFAEREEFDAAQRRAAEQTDPVFFAILDHRTGRCIGRCALLNIHPKNRSIEVGHLMFSSRLQRTRAATEAFFLLACYAFDELVYRRYEWKCNALNAKSRRAAERLGFQFEGIFRQHMIVKGRNRDTAWFSMLAEEWPAVKAGMQAWLAEDNFDEQGNQRQSLGELRLRTGLWV